MGYTNDPLINLTKHAYRVAAHVLKWPVLAWCLGVVRRVGRFPGGWAAGSPRGRGQLGQRGLFHSVVLTSNGNSYVQLGADLWWCSTTSKEVGDLLHPTVHLMVMANSAMKLQGT